MNTLHDQIVDKINDYVSGKITLPFFETWFTGATWNAESESHPAETINLIGTVELYLAEFSNGHRTLDELANLLSIAAKTQSQAA